MVPHWAFLRCRGLVCSPAVGRAGRGVRGGVGGDVQVFAAAAKPVCAADDTAPPGKPGPLLGARKVGLGSRQKWAHRNRY